MRVAVIGLGFAGLRAMQLLEAAGIECEGFEARDRIGGRCHTVVDGDIRFEAGGEWIDGDHHRVIELAKLLDVPLFEKPSSDRWYWFGDDRCTSSTLWPEAAEDVERLETLAVKYIRVGHPGQFKNLQQFIDAHASSDRSRWYLSAIYRSDEGDDPAQIGFAGWLRGFANYVDREGDEVSALRFRNGASSLLDAMRDQIKGLIRLGLSVDTVRIVDGSWRVGDSCFDRVIVTLPPPIMSCVNIEPKPSDSTQMALSSTKMSRANKVAFVFDHAWWHDLGWGGNLQYDGLLQQLWDGSLSSTPVLNAYICGEATEQARESACRDELIRLFPIAKRHLLRVEMIDWVNDPNSQGAFSHFPPGFEFDHYAEAWLPQNGLHFAGEHTAKWYGFIEGALESAERVMKEITDGHN